MNVTQYEIKDIAGKITLQFFTEGDYDWSQKVVEYSKGTYLDYGFGRWFAQSSINTFDSISKLYGIDLYYEFYQNGKKIRIFTGE